MMSNEKRGGGHGERSVAVGTLAKAIWDAVAKIADRPLFEILAERHGGVPDRRVFVYAAGRLLLSGQGPSPSRTEMRS
jgi:hypothetical protein